MEKLLFDDIIEYPNDEALEKYNALIGLDETKKKLIKETEIILNPMLLSNWSVSKYGKVVPLVKIFENRHSLIIIAGDVGTGKTTLAETFGDCVARTNNLRISLFSLSLDSRGSGAPGEMTRYISQAFSEIKLHMSQFKKSDRTILTTSILLIDEADALAESRDAERMHHEDKAGVNGLVQGIDMIAKLKMPVITVLCTNRLESLDPAVKRRAAAIIELHRPDEEQRYHIFKTYLEGTPITDGDIRELAKITGETEHRSYPYTYSDIIRKVLPALVLETYPNDEITKDKIKQIIERTPPTAPLTKK